MPVTLKPVQAESVRVCAETWLRDAITSGSLRSGAKLIERELCASMGISRPLLREVLRRLEAEKLIVLIPHRGPVVASVSIAAARDIYGLRRLLESHAAEQFALRASEAEIKRLATAVARLGSAARKRSAAAVLKAKSDFYAILLAGAGNALVQETLQGLLSRISLLRGTSLMLPERLPRSLEEITTLLACIQARDAAGARSTADLHLRHAEEAAVRVLAAGLADITKAA